MYICAILKFCHELPVYLKIYYAKCQKIDVYMQVSLNLFCILDSDPASGGAEKLIEKFKDLDSYVFLVEPLLQTCWLNFQYLMDIYW